MIRSLFLFVVCTSFLSCKSSHEQLACRYAQFVMDLHPKMHEVYNWTELNAQSQRNGPAVFKVHRIDTLASHSNYSHVERDEYDLIDQDVKVAYGVLRNDSLIINISAFMEYQQIEHVVFDGKMTLRFRERFKSDDLVKLEMQDDFTNDLFIPLTKTKFKLSKKRDFIKGELIYGCAKFITKPYFLKPLGFDMQAEQISRNCSYCFKFYIR